MKPQQSKRSIGISTALGTDALLLTRFSLRERMSMPFEIEADLAAVDPETDFNKVVGHKATIRLELGENGTRYFNGFVSRLAQSSTQGQLARYRATIVPWLWFLTRTADCRVFQRKSALDIAEDVFAAQRFGSEFYDLQTSASYPKRRDRVQYRETDFNFVNRLFESEGIYYWFNHSDGKHRLVLADRIGASKPAKGYEKIDFHVLEQGQAGGREVVTQWMVEKEVETVQYQLKDFDFKKPSDPLKGRYEVSKEYGLARFAQYDYPGDYFEPGDANRYAQVRLEEMQARHEVVHGVTSAMGLAVGGVFELQKHPQSKQNRKFLITDLSLTADAGDFVSGEAVAGRFFECHFSAIPADTPFRPARVTPKPFIQGAQTATVVGPSGEEIYVDEYSRVKIQFHWDRYGKNDADSSCWVRVAQPWAGKNWGAVAIPRIGHEVLVEFLEGDPDRPIIAGRVYNAENMPPYDLPGNQTQTGIKSRSSKGGGGANFNEIRFEDKKGSEMLTVHAEKDQEIGVEHDESHWVGHDRQKNIDHDETTHVKHDRTETVDNNETITIHGNRTETVDKDETITIHGNRTEKVDKDETITIQGNRTEKVSKDESITIDGNRTEKVAKDESITISGGRTEKVSKDESITISGGRTENVSKDESITISGGRTEKVSKDESITIGGGRTEKVSKDEGVTVSGGRTVKVGKDDTLSVGKKLTITAGEEISLTTGSASITMKKDGTISISGKDIQIEGSGAINAKASKNITMKGQKILQN